MRPIVDPRFFTSVRIVSRVVLGAMLLSVLYALWMSVANWTWIGV
jgi:hypothetical protein